MMEEGASLVRIARQARIVGGVYAAEAEFPYQVSLSYDGDFLCGGSILSTLLILTAAHCVKYKRPSRLLVTAGHHDISSNGTSTGYEQIRKARYIYMHENYVWETDVNDIAIIALSSPLQYSSHVQNISLPRVKEQFDGYATVTGWGRIKEKGDTSDILRKVKIEIVKADKCKKVYKKVRMTVTDDMMCAGESGRDSCQGDSGGPLACLRESEGGNKGIMVLCGIISHGHGFSRGKCKTDQFYCSSGGGCIERTFLCDMENDCEDGEEELNCAYMANCDRKQFRCNNGRCINKEWTCDDMDDCGDRSDEDKCPNPSKTCSTGEHQCGLGGRCIPDEWKCDSQIDCDDGNDEENCGNDTENEIDDELTKPIINITSTPAPCSASEYYCSRDYRCIPLRTGDDEIGCKEEEYERNSTEITYRPISTSGLTFITSTARPSSTSTTTKLPSTNTPRLNHTTDINISTFFSNFNYESDERGCVVDEETTCSQYFWQCGNGQCIYHRFRCDNDKDCTDETDEQDCHESTPVASDEPQLDDYNFTINEIRRRRRRRRKFRKSRG
ncbi:Trypsin-1 [Orchesella cincta]|uniref:Acrosin n=1 Tax=Orchesella cincta TaxID=48709 RepID=A0A1D2NFU3_ORCCI|nr:Trypsin-1 [Orchesella cincta]